RRRAIMNERNRSLSWPRREMETGSPVRAEMETPISPPARMTVELKISAAARRSACRWDNSSGSKAGTCALVILLLRQHRTAKGRDQRVAPPASASDPAPAVVARRQAASGLLGRAGESPEPRPDRTRQGLPQRVSLAAR